MDDLLAFADRNEFRAWLGEHCASSGGDGNRVNGNAEG